jgi:hypothetical protein
MSSDEMSAVTEVFMPLANLQTLRVRVEHRIATVSIDYGPINLIRRHGYYRLALPCLANHGSAT